MAEILEETALLEGRNVLVDGSMRDGKWYASHITDLRKRFPRLRVAVIHVSFLLIVFFNLNAISCVFLRWNSSRHYYHLKYVHSIGETLRMTCLGDMNEKVSDLGEVVAHIRRLGTTSFSSCRSHCIKFYGRLIDSFLWWMC